jgi:hypothetical protein
VAYGNTAFFSLPRAKSIAGRPQSLRVSIATRRNRRVSQSPRVSIATRRNRRVSQMARSVKVARRVRRFSPTSRFSIAAVGVHYAARRDNSRTTVSERNTEIRPAMAPGGADGSKCGLAFVAFREESP